MIPILFEASAREFSSHGIGDLIDCTECTAKITNEGEYELSFVYPSNSELFSKLQIGRIVVAKANDYDEHYQAFRIYGYEKEINGLITVNCQHISYDLVGIPIKPYKTKDMTGLIPIEVAVVMMKTHAIPNRAALDNNFTIEASGYTGTDKPFTQDGFFEVTEPTSARAILLDGDDSIIGSFGGDIVYDNFNITLKKVAGRSNAATFTYGVDIIDLTLENNMSEVVTGVVPYWKGRFQSSSSDQDIWVYGDVCYATQYGSWPKDKIVPVDLSEYFPDSQPTAAQLNTKAAEWMAANHTGAPDITCTINYANIGQDVRMYDEVKIVFPKMNIDETAKVTSYTYDVLNERCTEIEVSNVAHSSMWRGLEDASRLKRGLLPPKRIGNNSISSNQIGAGQVGSGNISGGAISGWHLVGGAVGSSKENDDGAVPLAEKAVKTKNVYDKAVEYAKLAGDVQTTFAEVFASKTIFTNFLNAFSIQVEGGGYLSSNYIYVSHLVSTKNGYHEYEPQSYSVLNSAGTAMTIKVLADVGN